MIQAGIYKIQSPDNGVYIGQTKNFKQRIRFHLKDTRPNKNLSRSFNTHGKSNHAFGLIYNYTTETTQEHFDYVEKFYVELYRSMGFVIFNIREAGSNGRLPSEIMAAIAAKNKGRKQSAEARAKKQGDAHPMRKLSSTAVLIIREAIALGIRQKELSRYFNVVPGVICDIKNGRKWTSVK